jgi:hypothetical protein
MDWIGLDSVGVYARYEYLSISPTQSFYTYLPMKIEQCVPKRRYIKFRRRGITQKKSYNIQFENLKSRTINVYLGDMVS